MKNVYNKEPLKVLSIDIYNKVAVLSSTATTINGRALRMVLPLTPLGIKYSWKYKSIPDKIMYRNRLMSVRDKDTHYELLYKGLVKRTFKKPVSIFIETLFIPINKIEIEVLTMKLVSCRKFKRNAFKISEKVYKQHGKLRYLSSMYPVQSGAFDQAVSGSNAVVIEGLLYSNNIPYLVYVPSKIFREKIL